MSKQSNTLLYAGVALAAMLLINKKKKENSEMAGIGAKRIRADFFDPKTGYMEFTIGKKQYWLQGDYSYDPDRNEYYSTFYGKRDGEYIIYVKRD